MTAASFSTSRFRPLKPSRLRHAFPISSSRHAPLDLVVGPSGYGLPLTAARDLTDADLRLAFLAAEGESGGIGGLRSLVRALGACVDHRSF